MINILFVDDSPTQTTLVTELFNRQGPEFRVTAVSTGTACLQELSRSKFTVILLDYILPDINGLEVFSKLREQGCTLPVIMVTGQGGEQVAVEAMKAGAADYVTKNEDFVNVLPVVVRQVLEKETLKVQLAEAEKRLQTLQKISLDISLELKLERIGGLIADGIRNLTRSQMAFVMIVRPDSDTPEIMASTGLDMMDPKEKAKIGEWGIWNLLRERSEPVLIKDAGKDPKVQDALPRRPAMRAALAVPLSTRGKIIGGLMAANPVDRSAYDRGDRDILVSLTLNASAAIENARYVQRTERLAVTDGLTGLYNHREFHKRLEQEIERAERYERPLAILMMDIDHFKSFNDTFGHPFGDEILKKISALLGEQIRTVDILARYGGEEFSLVLPETSPEHAMIVAERIRSKTFEMKISTNEGTKVQVTISIGLASLEDAGDRVDLVSAADKALYIAKEAGRNRICRYSDTFDKMAQSEEIPVEDLRTGLLKNLAVAAEAKSPYTKGQSEQVVRLTQALAKSLNLTADETEGLRQASLFHNIGTINISGRILNKPEPLTNEEQKVIRAHPMMAEMLLRQSPHLETIVPAVLYHHERYDGKGYPSGMKGDEIPYPARILAVASAYQAMISDRPYRRRMSDEEAKEELRRNAETQFDPKIVGTFIRVLESRKK